MKHELLHQAANQARGLAIDAVHACSSGHLGLPLGCAEIGAVLWTDSLQYHPAEPRWINRDRFILSAGHGSMFLYSWLHLAGYDLTLDQVKAFRQLHSGTPGHPENFETPGVEATTGPLGQGIGNAVGYAISGQRAKARFNTADQTILDYHVIALFGDGCMQEGVAQEASSLAGHLGLDNLILIYDSNDVTLDAMAKVTQSEDVGARYAAYGFDVTTIDGHDLDAVKQALDHAKADDNGKPKLIIARTEIGRGIPEVAGTAKAHGEGGANFAESARAGLGLPADQHFFVSDEVRALFAERQAELAAKFTAWQQGFDAWSAAHPELAAELTTGLSGEIPADLLERIPTFPSDAKVATRAAGGDIIQTVAASVPSFLTGSADLFGSTKNYLKGAGDFSATDRLGRNIWFGIREHAMGAICNGIAYDGLFRASCATFAVFADYLRPSIRLAALSGLPVIYIFTHDSVGVGEDGPTHQPVETCSGLRVIPNLDVMRPGDAEETAAAFVGALERQDGPTVLLLTRQNIPMLNTVSVEQRREGTLRGGYVVRPESGDLKLILLATGSEVQHAIAAAEQLGDGVRVVSLPCLERFDRQDAAYREQVLPSSCTKRVAIEAGVPGLWWKYVGTEGRVVAIDRFGISAPGDTVMSELGMTAGNLAATARELWG